MLSFRTPKGAAFDGVALDIESLSLKSAGLRTTRLLALSRILRNEAGETPVAAITYPSRGFERHPTWWPGFPWQQLTALVDAWIPMTYTGGGFKGYDATYGYVARSLRLLRTAVGPDIPIHAAGGVANRMKAEELKAFVDAVTDEGIGDGLEPLRLPDDRPEGAGLRWRRSEPARRGAVSRPAACAIESRLPSARAARERRAVDARAREPRTLSRSRSHWPTRPALLLALDRAPEPPGPLGVAALRGDDRELGARRTPRAAVAEIEQRARALERVRLRRVEPSALPLELARRS